MGAGLDEVCGADDAEVLGAGLGEVLGMVQMESSIKRKKGESRLPHLLLPLSALAFHLWVATSVRFLPGEPS